MLSLPDPSLVEKKKRLFVDSSLQRAVDFQVFALSAALIEAEVSEETVREACLLLQPRHWEEIVEERCNNDLCGYVLCAESLSEARKRERRSARRERARESVSVSESEAQQPRYRIEYKTKRIFEVNEEAAFFCCTACFEQSERWKRSLDTSLPYSRPAARQLLREEALQGESTTSSSKKDIDDILALFARGEDAVRERERERDSKKKSERERQEDLLAPPPLYAKTGITERGTVEGVQFQPGLPLVSEKERDAAAQREKEQETESEKKASKSLRFAVQEEREKEKEVETQNESDDAPGAVYLPAHLTTSAHNDNDIDAVEKETETTATEKEQAKKKQPIIAEKEHSAPADIAALLQGMQALQMKYDLSPSTQIAPPVIPPSFVPKKSATIAAKASAALPAEQRSAPQVITTRIVQETEVEATVPTQQRKEESSQPPAPPAAERPTDTTKAQNERDQANENELLEAMQSTDKDATKKKVRTRRVKHVVDWTLPPAPPSPHIAAAASASVNEAQVETPREVVGSSAQHAQTEVAAPVAEKSTSIVPATPASAATSTSASVAPKSILKKNYKPIPKVKPILAMSINEKPNAVPLSAAALLSKREPSAIEGYVPEEVYYVED